MARFVNAHLPEVVQPFWAALQAGEFIADAAVHAGTYRRQGTRWVAACGGVRPRRGRNLGGRGLTFAEREEIALARARGESMPSRAPRAAPWVVPSLPPASSTPAVTPASHGHCATPRPPPSLTASERRASSRPGSRPSAPSWPPC
jgi:hypothetical protein